MYIYTWRGGIYWTHTSQLLTEQRTLNKETVGREKVYSNIKKLFMFINNKLRVLRTFFCKTKSLSRRCPKLQYHPNP